MEETDPTLALPPSCQASLDQPTQTVVMHRTEPTAQQNLALQLAEKLGSLVENNERVFDHKQGTYGGYFRGECSHPLFALRILAPFPPVHWLSPPPLPISLLQTRKTATGKTRATCAEVATASSNLRRPTEGLTCVPSALEHSPFRSNHTALKVCH